MIKDMIEPFKKAVLLNENIILDNYKLKDGLYIKLDINNNVGIFDDNYIIVNNQNKENDGIEVKNLDLFKWFREMDYYSVILNNDTNKCIDLPAKKILSNNWMTIFIKKEKFPHIGKKSVSKEIILSLIEKYFETLKKAEEKFVEIHEKSNYIKGKFKKEEKENFLQNYFKEQIKYIRSDVRKKGIEENKKFFLNHFDEIIQMLKAFEEEHSFNGYIKIFIKKSAEVYKMENQVYTIPRIFNVNDYNVFLDGEIQGLPSNNITTNTKKPYLLLKTMQCNVPYREKAKEVLVAKKFFEWLEVNGKFKEIKLDYNYEFNGTEAHKKGQAYLSIHLNQYSEIDEFDTIPFDAPKLQFILYNVLGITEKINTDDEKSTSVVGKNEVINQYSLLQQKFSNYYFNNKFFSYFKDTDPDIKKNEFTGQMRALFMLSREALFDFFCRGIDTSIKSMIDKLTMDLIEENLKKTVQGFNFDKIARAYNLRISLLKYFDLRGMKMADKIKSVIDNLRIKLSAKNIVVCENDEEFYFTLGQLAYYILSQSERDKKTFGIFEPILNAKNSNQLKRNLKEIFTIYKHAISFQNIKFKNAMSIVMGYETGKKITDNMQEMLLAGLLANNIFYEKKED